MIDQAMWHRLAMCKNTENNKLYQHTIYSGQIWFEYMLSSPELCESKKVFLAETGMFYPNQ